MSYGRTRAEGGAARGGNSRPMALRWASNAICPPTLLFLLWSMLFFSGALFPDFFFVGNCFVCFVKSATMFTKVFSPSFVLKYTAFSLKLCYFLILKCLTMFLRSCFRRMIAFNYRSSWFRNCIIHTINVKYPNVLSMYLIYL